MSLRGINYGGGVQSTAMIVLAAQHQIDDSMGGPVTDAVFANTGDDSEDPRTLTYVRNIMTPWAAAHGITVHEARRTYADGTPYQTLHEFLVDPQRKGCPIPVRLQNGTPAGRSCTAEWKAKTVQRFWQQRGATKHNPVTKAIGYSTDEWHRANNRVETAAEHLVFPLLDLRLSRNDCEQIIVAAGLGLPPKSACWFCPWRTRNGWRDMKRTQPDLFEKAVALEQVISNKSQTLGHGPVYMTDDLVPLNRAVGDGVQGALFDEQPECAGGCWT